MNPDLFIAPDYYNLDDLLTEEHKLVRDASRSWVKKNVSPILVFTSSEFTGVTVYTGSQDDAGVNDCTVFPADQTAAEGAMTSTTATGASTTGYTWTWASVNGKL